MFIVYHIASTMQVGPTPNGYPHSGYAKGYRFAHHAKAAATNFNSKAWHGIGPGPYGYCHIDHYRARVVRTVERVNLQSGKTYLEASNTPGYCSPASEAYWSM